MITARDPATANDLGEVIPSLVATRKLVLHILAQEPACRYLETRLAQEGLLETVSLQRVMAVDDCGIESELEHLLTTFKPDLLISGVSGPGYGIDELALKRCNRAENIKTFSIQSYWGDINQSLGSPAQSMFVLDEFAADVTARRHSGIESIPIGPLQARRYDSFDSASARTKFRGRHRLSDSRPAVAFFGQPLFQYVWYKNSVSHLAKVLRADFKGIDVFYRPHPKETQREINWVSSVFSSSRLDFHKLGDSDSLTLLAGTDLAISLFSTVGYDLQNLLVRSGTAFSVPLYLFHEEGCKRWFWEHCHLDAIPMTAGETALVVESAGDLSSMIELGLQGDFRSACHHRLKINLPAGGENAINIILSAIGINR